MADDPITWTPESEEALSKAPFFARRRLRKDVEKLARERGQSLITRDFLTEAIELQHGKSRRLR